MNPNHHTRSFHKTKHTCRAAVAAAALFLCAVACTQQSAQETTERQTEAAPTQNEIGAVAGVDMAALDALLTEAKGKVLVINFWATWCVPCVAEMPELAEFYREHSRDDVAFLALSLDSPDGIEDTVKPFMRQHEIPFPAYVLTERDIEAISVLIRQEIYGALPTTIVYDRNGAVKKMWEGAITLDELNAVVKPLL